MGHLQNYIHVDDLCNGQASIERLLKIENLNFEKYHLANNREISLLEICQIIEKFTDQKLKRI